MANRIPLIVNASASQIQEVPSGDVVNFDNKVVLTNSTASSSKTVGAVVVTGGVGISGALNAGDAVTLSKASGTSLAVSSNQASSSKTTGAVTVVGGVGVSGNLNVGGDITAFATSDENWKDNLSPITNALTRVGLMTGYTFTWNDKAGTPQWTHLVGKDDTGLIAQDVEKLGLPGITTVRGDGAMAIRYDRLAAILTEAVKELKKENDDLKTLIKNSSSFANLKSSL